MMCVGIVGAGFSGTMVAAGLLRGGASCRVALIEQSSRFGSGLAYGAARPCHVLNVPAGRMGAWEGREGDFLEWLKTRAPGTSGGAFVRRDVYGQYLAHTLDEAETHAGPGTLQRIAARAVAAAPSAGGAGGAGGVRLTLSTGETLELDRLVLAVGNFPPADPAFVGGIAGDAGRYISDPWRADALDVVDAADDVLLIGSGLTMYDVAMELGERGRRGRMLSVSRRGLRPQPHRASSGKPAHLDPPASLAQWQPTARGMLAGVRREVREAAADGIDWREVVTSLRPVTAQLWQRLGAGERSRFLDRVRPYWDSHRHRAAPDVHQRIEELIQSEHLAVRGGRVISATEAEGRVRVDVRFRGERRSTSVSVDRVINCTGPDSDCGRNGGALLESMLESGMVTLDEHRLGLRSDERGRALNARGFASDGVRLIGPLRRPELWESTAVPELRDQAAALAAELAAELR